MVSLIKTQRLRELLQSADPTGEMFAQILPDGRLGLGSDPFRPEVGIDFGAERALQISAEGLPSQQQPAELPRQRGRPAYDFELRGQVIRSGSLKEVLRHGLLAFERMVPGTLEKLSLIKPRSKRIVAHDRNDLFESRNLTKDFSERLDADWWFGTNNSAQETRAWLERAAACSGLDWGRDCSTNF
jgi:hypothetical protein